MIRFRPAAARELAADYRHYERDYRGRGERFIRAVDDILTRIESAPDRYLVLYEPDIRSAKVRRFPDRVVYLAIDGTIDVIAVAHAKSRANDWRRRLPEQS